MDTYINLLNELDKGDPILTIDKSSCYNILVVEEMYNAGLIDATESKPYSGNTYHNVRISAAGREWLVMNNSKWYHSFQNRIAVFAVLATLLGTIVAVVALYN